MAAMNIAKLEIEYNASCDPVDTHSMKIISSNGKHASLDLQANHGAISGVLFKVISVRRSVSSHLNLNSHVRNTIFLLMLVVIKHRVLIDLRRLKTGSLRVLCLCNRISVTIYFETFSGK